MCRGLVPSIVQAKCHRCGATAMVSTTGEIHTINQQLGARMVGFRSSDAEFWTLERVFCHFFPMNKYLKEVVLAKVNESIEG